MKRRKVKKKKKREKLTFESKTAGRELKPGSSGRSGRKPKTGENESLQLKRDRKHDEARRRRPGCRLSV